MFTYALGAISAVMGMDALVSLADVSIHCWERTSVPFSMLSKARPPLSDGKVTVASSPKLYFSLSVANIRILELSESADAGLLHQLR